MKSQLAVNLYIWKLVKNPIYLKDILGFQKQTPQTVQAIINIFIYP